jgi:hypothetical protein
VLSKTVELTGKSVAHKIYVPSFLPFLCKISFTAINI